MTHKSVFRLLVRATGLLVAAEHMPRLAQAILGFTRYGAFRDNGTSPMEALVWYFIGPIVGICIGMYLLLRGGWVIKLAFPTEGPYCRECGCRVANSPAQGACPECSFPTPPQPGDH